MERWDRERMVPRLLSMNDWWNEQISASQKIQTTRSRNGNVDDVLLQRQHWAERMPIILLSPSPLAPPIWSPVVDFQSINNGNGCSNGFNAIKVFLGRSEWGGDSISCPIRLLRDAGEGGTNNSISNFYTCVISSNSTLHIFDTVRLGEISDVGNTWTSENTRKMKQR
mgnify:CR=1 FL=1